MKIKSIEIRIKEYFYILIILLIITDLSILLNIPFLRQILGFLFLTILLGLLVFQILKLNKLDFLEKFILAWGLSVSFLMFFGLLINNLSLAFGYKTPLSTISLLVTFNLTFIVLAIIGYKLNKDPVFSLPNVNLSTSEKAFLIIPIIFPALSIFGMHIMNTTDNNILLMILLFLIPTYIVFVCVFNHKFSKRLYPVVIFLISISLLLLMSLRSNHIIGVDTHDEYYLFRTTLDNLHWRVFGHTTFAACLSISLLPTVYQSILNISPEFLFKILYSLLYSITPLAVYVISKRYIEEGYAFLASCFFMFQTNFLFTELYSRTNTAILFFALAMMILFNDKIDPLKKRILFIVFMASCVVSHYSTAYTFFFIMLGTFVGMEIMSKKYTFKKIVSLTIVTLFFALIFFWYSQVTEEPFNAGVRFIEATFSNLNMFYIEELREGGTEAMLGGCIMQKGIPHRIQFVWTWLTFMFIGIGIITLIRRYKEMSFSEWNFNKPDFLKEKFEIGYFAIALICSGLLVMTIVLPHIAAGYSLQRTYSTLITILSVFFVIGGITLSKHFFFFKKKTCAKRKNNSFFGKAFFSKERFDGEKASQVRAYLIILLVLIPYFLCVTGVMYNIFDVPRSIVLNSEGEQYDKMYIHDQESYGVKWLENNADQGNDVYVGGSNSGLIFISQARILSDIRRIEHKKIDGYIYLGYYNVIDNKLITSGSVVHNMTEYSDIFVEKSRIYDNGGSEMWK